MASAITMYALLVFYAVLSAQTAMEERWWLTIYWLAAFVLNVAVMKMGYK